MTSVSPHRDWSPEGAETFAVHYPDTPAALADFPERNQIGLEFSRAWLRAKDARGTFADDRNYLFVRGLLGEWMPGHLAGPMTRFAELGLRASIAPTRTAGEVPENARRIVQHARRLSGRLVVLAHSKGGLEALTAAFESPEFRERIDAMVLVQTPRAPSPVLESLFLHSHARNFVQALKERAMAAALRAAWARKGCLELVPPRLPATIAFLDGRADELVSIPILSVATWSIEPCSWLDSYHRRLGQIRPRCAHDGQFFTEDMLWPRSKRLLLGGIDHAQPVVGGLGFDHGNFWLALTELVAERRKT